VKGEMIPEKILSATLIDSNGAKYCFDKISNVEITSTIESFNKNMTVSFDVLTNDNKEYFKIILPDKGEKELNGTVIYCRFETAKGSFNENTKEYAYYVPCKPEDCIIKKGTIFKVWDMVKGTTKYNGARLRCENMIGVMNASDAEVIVDKKLNDIIRIVIEGEVVSVNKNYIRCDILDKIEKTKNDNQFRNLVNSSNISKENDQIILCENCPINTSDEIDFSGPIISGVIDTTNKNETNILGGNDMNTNIFGNMFKNMKFGKLETNDIKYSMKGIAFKTTDGDYVYYNPDFTFTNVANMVIDMPIFAMPVSKEQIKIGDVIKHNDTWVIVNDVTPSEIKVAKPWTKEIISIIPETSIFGFSFYTKIMNPFENFGATATADNPFGNILPFILMSGGDTKNSNDMLMMMLAFGGGKIDFSNPMMMYMFMGDKDNINDILMMMMLTGNNPFEQKAKCKCMKDTTINVPCTDEDIFGWTTEGVTVNIENIDNNT
jgi:hypothetical protein